MIAELLLVDQLQQNGDYERLGVAADPEVVATRERDPLLQVGESEGADEAVALSIPDADQRGRQRRAPTKRDRSFSMAATMAAWTFGLATDTPVWERAATGATSMQLNTNATNASEHLFTAANVLQEAATGLPNGGSRVKGGAL
jgi:hypothetical protein